jgi:hypothetical protein
VKLVKGWKKWHRGWKLAAGRHGEPKEVTWGERGSHRKLAATYRKVSHRAAVEWHKRNVFRIFWTQGNCGPWKELATAGREMTCCAEVVWRREHGLQRQGKDDNGTKNPEGMDTQDDNNYIYDNLICFICWQSVYSL